jgi:DNA-directed RNA polymerase specialized sigma24 family protein
VEADVFRRLQEADWDTICRALIGYARHRASYYAWRGGGTFELAVGQTIEDIVQETIKKTCSGERRWDPGKGPLERWLRDQVKSIMDHLAKSAPNRYETQGLETIIGNIDDGLAMTNTLEYNPPESARVASAEEVVLKKEEIEEECYLLIDAADDDEQLKQMVDLVWNGYEKAQEIAEAMGISANEVYTLTRKLKRRVVRKREKDGTSQRA